MRHGSLFSGVGGFDLAAQWMGWENMFHCEWNQFGQKVLKYYWPNAISYDDICKTDFTIWNGRIDILTGGFPCQPYSMAGKRQGTEDSRHLWPEMLRAIRECRPTWIVGENVPGLINWSGGLVFEQVCADLEGEGYEVQPVVLPASGVNAPHRRDRVWFVAYNISAGLERREGVNGRKEFEPLNRNGLRDSLGTSRKGYTSKIRPTQNPNEDGRRGDERKEESSIGRFGNIGAGDNERIRTDFAKTWVKVVFASDCIYEDWDTDRECPTCPECGSEYSECECPGPTMDEYEYKIEGGIMYARLITDTSAEGLQRGQLDGAFDKKIQIGREQPPRPAAKRHKITDWTDWPTVAPLRDGNDGVSSKLDGITFPKWRNESIKAGGNAIVPQVALQIFKVIEQMQNT